MAICRNFILEKCNPCPTYFYKELEAAGFISTLYFWTHFSHTHITFIIKLLWILKATFEINCLTRAFVWNIFIIFKCIGNPFVLLINKKKWTTFRKMKELLLFLIKDISSGKEGIFWLYQVTGLIVNA